jgi:hypothetical protein
LKTCARELPRSAERIGRIVARRCRSSVATSTEEVLVAIARIIETRITPAEYDQMRVLLGIGDTPPPGGLFHVAAIGEDGSASSRFGTRARRPRPGARRSWRLARKTGVGSGPPVIEYLEIHSVVQR